MIAALILATAAGLPLGELPQQTLAAGRCATFLWTRTEPPIRVAMADEGSRTLRIMRQGKMQDLPLREAGVYAGEDLTVRLDLELAERSGLAQGTIVEAGAMAIEPADGEAFVVPVGGIRACR